MLIPRGNGLPRQGQWSCQNVRRLRAAHGSATELFPRDSGVTPACGGASAGAERRRLLAAVGGVGVWMLGLQAAAGPDSSAAAPDPARPAPVLLHKNGSTLAVDLPAALPAARRAILLAWIEESADAIIAYFGRFPVGRVAIRIEAAPGREIHGTTYGEPSARMIVPVGREARDEVLRHSWVMTHEMVHLAIPYMGEGHGWLHEGLASYVEPIARARIGVLPVESVWRDLVDGMPKGLPVAGDRGLDGTPTWGRTYWGGALFCLMADLEMRTLSDTRRGLQQALRAITGAGGNLESEWPIERVLSVADAGFGGSVLSGLYHRMGNDPVTVDLEALWKDLGVIRAGDSVRFDEQAPRAALRRAIMQAPDAG